jgi:hypothetical protein
VAVIDIQRDAIGRDELNQAFARMQQVLIKVVQYSQPIRDVQIVCNHPQQIINLQ